MTLHAITPEFTARLRAVLPAAAFRDSGPAYLEEPRGRWQGRAGLVVAPASTAEVAEVVRACSAARVGIVPFGGGTGLVGGQIAPEPPAPLILSLERMRAIRAVDPGENVLVAEAGAVLAEVQAAAAGHDRLFPLSLAAEGTARIGGNLATNAGGVTVLRYGNARDLCLGLEAVLPDGQVWHGLSRLRKDNTGYDLRHLLIGSEGTLGIITAASLRLFPRPAETAAGIFAVPGPEAAVALLGHAQARVGEGLTAFELIGRTGLDFLAQTMPQTRQPLMPPPEWSVLIDLGLPAGSGAGQRLEALAAEAAEAGLVADGVLARSEAQRAAFWALREAIPLANRNIGAVSSHDISVPVGEIPRFIARADAEIAALGPFRVNCFGHVGDGNLHYNVFPPPGQTRADHEHRRDEIKRTVHDLVHAFGGSVSAEHGIGRLKVADLERYGDPVKLHAMRAIKAALDPLGIMNPGAVLRPGR